MSAKLDDFDVDVSDINVSELNTSSINVATFSSEKLCEIIACDRYFGSYKKLSISCMEELANRRIKGDTFEFENYIDNSLKDYPKLDMAVPDVGNVLRQLTGKFTKR